MASIYILLFYIMIISILLPNKLFHKFSKELIKTIKNTAEEHIFCHELLICTFIDCKNEKR